MQGHLRGEPLRFTITTQCAHCGQPIHIEMDSALKYQVQEKDAHPLVFVPMISAAKIKDKSIIDKF